MVTCVILDSFYLLGDMKGSQRPKRMARELLVCILGWLAIVMVYFVFGTSIHHSSLKTTHVIPLDLTTTSNLKASEPLDSITTIALESKCAPAIPVKDRRVLFVELHSWEKYYGPSKYKTGEYYVSASWDYALRRNGFHVDRVSTRYFFERMTPSEMRMYHRIFIRDPKWSVHFNHHDILCRTRPMYYFGEWYQNKVKFNEWFIWPFDKKQILVAHPEDFNTFMGYFPHNLLLNWTTPQPERGKIGLLYGKKPEYFVPYQALIKRLIAEGFELHSTCTDNDSMKCPFPPAVIQHQNLGPAEYSTLLTKFSFMLGFQKVSELSVKTVSTYQTRPLILTFLLVML